MDSFRDVPFWYNELKRCAPDAFVMLVGTKSDEVDNVIVKTGDVMKLVSGLLLFLSFGIQLLIFVFCSRPATGAWNSK